MKNPLVYLTFLFTFTLFAQEEPSTNEIEYDEEDYLRLIDSVNNSYTFQKGLILLGDDLAAIQVPAGFKYLDGDQSEQVLSELWGNPPTESLGLLFPENSPILGESFSYAIEITYSEEGYIEDDDAEDIDYDELLEQMQEDALAVNEERQELGYPAIEIVGWATPPFYDQKNKKLHWAKEIKFEGEEINTLNYNIRILGRKGYLNMNAIGEIDQLPLVQKDIDKVIASAEFVEGNRYSDFNPDLDDVAAYGIGGLIAGKVLAKAGVFAMLLKFWKLIAVGAVGLFGAFRKKIFGSKEN